MASLTNEATASSSSSLPLSSTDQNHYTYEVFLSFRGEDTRSNFTDHLHGLLCDRGIETFIDDELKRGEEISSALVKAIEESRVSIIVFSQNYASSRGCLDELVKILECRKSRGQEVRAVFYKVDPSDVRHQRGAFGEALATLDQCKYKDSMEKWKTALKEAADLSGWPFKDGESEAKFIRKIVGELSARIVNPSCVLQVAAHPIGIESCRQDVIRLLHAEENIVRMVGIWGPGGIGKTTIAKDLFNSIRHKFGSSCFLADVGSNGLAQLQETLLFDILNDSTLKVRNVDKGVSLIKTRMRNRKVLLVFDDVSHSSQLQNLVPSPDCFGPNSRIIITTRDKRLLTAHLVDEVYEVKMLDYDRALELFSLNAFKRNRPPSDYLKLARHAIHYAQGLPLALIVLGSHLFGRSIEEWEATIGSCKGGPHTEIQDVLRLSYDALGSDLKELFLDIACFFKGKHVAHVKAILEACYDLKTMMIGIAQLQEKALIKIDKDLIWMHDLIEEMGKDIVYQVSPSEPGKRSRVWSEEDVNHVLTNNAGTNKVIGIQAWPSFMICLNAKSFSQMKNLRYISMSKFLIYEGSSGFSGDIDYLSNQLRWLDWPDCPLQSFPSDFNANKLVKLNIRDSWRIKRLWEGRKNFSRLTCMNLSGCEFLTELPDFSGIPNLKELDLCDCKSLVEVHDFVGFLPNLVILNIRGCESLTELPDLSGIPNLKELDLSYCKSLVGVPDSLGLLYKLVTLNVDGCANLIKFPRKIYLKYVETISITCRMLEEFSEVGEELGFLRKLNLSGTCIKELHPSITLLIGLEVLELCNCKNLTTLPYNIYELENLEFLNASNCLKLTTFPEIPLKMGSLRSLNLSYSDIRELDESIVNLIGLEELHLSDCKNLTTLPCSIYELQNLRELHLSNCSKLVRFPEIPIKMDSLRSLDLSYSDIRELDESIVNLIGLEELHLSDCKNLTTLPCSIYELQNLKRLSLNHCSKLVRFPRKTNIMNVDGCLLSLPKLQRLCIGGCRLSDCDFLMTLDCWETLEWLDLSFNDFVSLPACITKFVNLWWLVLVGCKRLREIPELPPNVYLDIRTITLELLEERFSTLTNRGAVIEAASLSIEEPTPSSWISLSSETPKRHCSAEEPSMASPAELSWLSLSTEPTPVNPLKRQRTAPGGQASMVHFAYEMAIPPVPMFPDLHSAHHSTTPPQLQHQEEPTELSWLSLNSSEPTKPRGPVKGDQD